MTTNELVQLTVIFALLLLAPVIIPITVYLSVKLGTGGYYQARNKFFKRTNKRDDNAE